MIDTIEATITERELFDPATPVVLMVSGGSDSTALAYLMADFAERGLVGELAILHVNHKLRGEASDGDQRFVQALADALGIPCFVCEVNIGALLDEQGGNLEAVAREQRYLAAHEALESLARHAGVPVSMGRIATAHTQDDRAENFYMRSIKGTGPGGFRSMLYRNGPVVRPLLDVSRAQLRDYLHWRVEEVDLPVCRDEAGFLWRDDATNAHTDRFRTYVRNLIVPKCKKQNPQLLDTLTRTMNLIADEDDFLNELAAEAFEEHVEVIGAENAGPGEAPDGLLLLPGFATVHRALQRRVVLACLQVFLGTDARIEAATVEAVLGAFANGAPISGYVTNVQGDLAISANKRGVRIEHMAVYRSRRKKRG